MLENEFEIESADDRRFLKAIYGDNIPKSIEREVYPNSVIVYTVGKPNIRRFVEKAWTLL